MVKQGDIIMLDLSPHSGHEQSGYRPALVVSNYFFNSLTNMTIVCPITNTGREFPLHVALDNRTTTTGVILCEHIKSVDLSSRNYKIVDHMPDDLLNEVINRVFAEIEKQ